MSNFSQSEYYETPGMSMMGASVGRNVFSNIYAGGNNNTELLNACRLCLHNAGSDKNSIRNCYIPSFDNEAPCNEYMPPNSTMPAYSNIDRNYAITIGTDENEPYYSAQGMPLAFGP